jgi:beta-lysine N6-acetyltransferase
MAGNQIEKRNYAPTMDEIAKDLITTLGGDILDSRETFARRADGIELQYDPYNRRLKFFDMAPTDVAQSPQIASCVMGESVTPLYSKLIVYARPGGTGWSELGFRREAEIWGFFGDGDNAELWARYLVPPRAEDLENRKNEELLAVAKSRQRAEPILLAGYTCAPARPADAADIAELMRETFPDYPTPISDDYITANMRDRTFHFRVVRDAAGRLVASASAEMHHTRKSAELTDCATSPQYRGKGLMSAILRHLERDLADEFGITDVYTIARASQAGVNCSFAKLGYTYTGRLVNNCRMPEGYESMNVWCRDTSDRKNQQ